MELVDARLLLLVELDMLSLLIEPLIEDSTEAFEISPFTSPIVGDIPSATALVCRCWTLRTIPAV